MPSSISGKAGSEIRQWAVPANRRPPKHARFGFFRHLAGQFADPVNDGPRGGEHGLNPSPARRRPRGSTTTATAPNATTHASETVTVARAPPPAAASLRASAPRQSGARRRPGLRRDYPELRDCPRSEFTVWVRCLTSRRCVRCSVSSACTSSFFTVANRMPGHCAASQIDLQHRVCPLRMLGRRRVL